ncbi:hypothetical protein [Gordonia terrae]
MIARDELRRWVRKLAGAAGLADLKQAFCLGPEPQRPAQRGGTPGDIIFYSLAGLSGPGAYLFGTLSGQLPTNDVLNIVIAAMAVVTPLLACWVYRSLYYPVNETARQILNAREARGRLRDWRRVVEQAAAHVACTGRDDHSPDQPPVDGDDLARRRADAARALEDLLGAWGHYKLDTEAWYLTKPLLHDTTGTVGPTVAYNTAMANLTAAVEALHDQSPASDVDRALTLADRAWTAWHDANDHAAAVGLDDRSPTERAALQRLNKLITRLAYSGADDPALAAVKRDITLCLDRIHTIAVSWADIAALPALDQRLIRQLPTGIAQSNPGHVDW